MTTDSVTTDQVPGDALPRLATGVPGLDVITFGGLPAGEVTLVSGTSGSGKTVFSMAFLAEGIRQFDQPGVCVTFGERPDKLRRFVVEFGWDVLAWEQENNWAFVDATVDTEAHTVIVGENFDLGILVSRIAAAVKRIGARRVVLDSLNDLFAHFGDRTALRDGLVRLFAELERMQVTAVVTIARREEYGEVAMFGVEDLLADNIIVLRNVLLDESRRRTVEVLKFRGTTHRRGEFPFAITRANGLVVIALAKVTLSQSSGQIRTSTGLPVLDQMLHGGLFRDSITLLSGATGTGKTVLALQFVLAAVSAGEPALFVGFEESTDQLSRTIRAWGYDLDTLQQQGKLRFLNDYPELASLEEHVVRIESAIEEMGAQRLAVDSLSTLRRIGSDRGFREFTIGLAGYLKEHHVTALFTTTQAALLGGSSATNEHVSALSDVIFLLRYVEVGGEIRRAVTVLKHRGSVHDKSIREFTIDPDGIHIHEPLRAMTGILSGHPDTGGLDVPDPL